jgi:Fe2+ transport system protein FeoA
VKCTMCGSTAGCQGCPIAGDFYLPATLASLGAGERATVRRLAAPRGGDLRKLLALGLLPGVEVEVARRWPAMVVRMGFATVALDAALAAGVIVSRGT